MSCGEDDGCDIRRSSETEQDFNFTPLVVVLSYSQEFGDGVRLGPANAAVTGPNNPPLTVGEVVLLL